MRNQVKTRRRLYRKIDKRSWKAMTPRRIRREAVIDKEE